MLESPPKMLSINCIHYKLASPDFIYENAFYWRNYDELDDVLDQLSIDNLIAHSNESYAHFMNAHHIKHLKNYLAQPIIYGKKINLKEVEQQIKSHLKQPDFKAYLDKIKKFTFNELLEVE